MQPWPDDWITAHWPGNPQVLGVFTSRQGGASVGPYGGAPRSGRAGAGGMNLGGHVGDDPHAVAANRARLAERLGGVRIAYLDQVHGNSVADLDAWDGSTTLRADAAVSSTPDLAACVLVADCLPVLFAAPEGRAVAAAHAGWRGLAGGVLENALLALCCKAKCEPNAVQAWLGPAIGPLAFEVGGEVRTAFVDRQAETATAFRAAADPGKWLADLFALARLRLGAAGMRPEHIQGGNVCTVSNPDRYYAFRRDRVTGRQAGLVWIVADARRENGVDTLGALSKNEPSP
ncbi:laccase domain protein YfiH [mine drainage metagenome]|uniref:Laccase domain protein YfiH n=1 Tax=mine drainage metagenome TaxID=410659 RepID=A0A1J5RUZ2_9ZZZZ